MRPVGSGSGDVGDVVDRSQMLVRRVASWWWDYLVVLAWLVGVGVGVGVPTAFGWIDLSRVWSVPLAADVAVALLTVLPYLLYLLKTESGRHRATWGKRRGGLVVRLGQGSRGRREVIVRNVVKVIPWQLGHMAAMRFAGAEDGVPVAAIVCFTTSMALLAAIVVPVLRGGRGLHDRLAGTAVVASSRSAASAAAA